MPWAALILTVLLVAFSFLANRTALGRHANAVGGNAEAAPRRHRGPARARSRV